MNIPVKPLFILAVVSLFAAAPAAWGQESGSNPARPRDIAGNWILELGPGCAGLSGSTGYGGGVAGSLH